MCLNKILRKLYGTLPKGNQEENYGFTEDAMFINLTSLVLVYPKDEFTTQHNHEIRFFIKLIGFLLCLFCTVMCLVLFPTYQLFAFLTNWTVLTNLL